MEKVGRYAFLGGVILAVLAGFMSGSWIYPVLTVLGLAVGLLNVTATETQGFLLAAVSMVIVSAFGSDHITSLPEVGETIGGIYRAMLAFVSPAAIIVALKALFGMAKAS